MRRSFLAGVIPAVFASQANAGELVVRLGAETSQVDWPSIIGNGVSTLVGAFVGAAAAFILEFWRRWRERRNANAVAGNLALFTLYEMWNATEQHRIEAIEKYRAQPDRWLNVGAGMPLTFRALQFNTSALAFLLRSNASLFSDLVLEEQRFAHLSEMVRMRSDLIMSEVYPRLSAAGVAVGEGRDPRQIEAIITNGIVHQLKTFTDAIVLNLDENLVSERTAFNRLREALKVLLPKHHFIKLQPDAPPARPANEAMG